MEVKKKGSFPYITEDELCLSLQWVHLILFVKRSWSGKELPYRNQSTDINTRQL